VPPTRVRTVDLPAILGPWCDRNGVELVVDLVDPIPRDLDLLGFMLHHDVSAAGAFRERTTGTIKFGHKKLKGPLANLHVPRNRDADQATIIVTTLGLARDSGLGDPAVLEAMRADRVAPNPKNDRDKPDTCVNGNPFFLDVEVANDGVDEDYQPGQLRATCVAAAAVCAHFGWNPRTRVKHHREWTTGKIDMSHKGDLLVEIERLMGGGTTGEDELASSTELLAYLAARSAMSDILGRTQPIAGDDEGLMFWTKQMRDRPVIDVLQDLANSAEGKAK
jgi:hypothetical protein